jgi:hypothetical protein
MRRRKPLLTIFVFMLPALTALATYTAFHETLFKKPVCQFNCDFSQDAGFLANSNSAAKNRLKSIIEQISAAQALAASETNRLFDLNATVDPNKNIDTAYLLAQIAALGQLYDPEPQYGGGYLHHEWARLNKENALLRLTVQNGQNQVGLITTASSLNKDINEYDFMGEYPNKVAEAKINTPAIDCVGANCGEQSLITMALAPSNGSNANPNYLVASPIRIDTRPGIDPTSNVPLPASFYFMTSALLVFGATRYANRKKAIN